MQGFNMFGRHPEKESVLRPSRYQTAMRGIEEQYE